VFDERPQDFDEVTMVLFSERDLEVYERVRIEIEERRAQDGARL